MHNYSYTTPCLKFITRQKMLRLLDWSLLSALFFCVSSLKPVAIVHGIMFNLNDRMTFLEQEILRNNQSTVVRVLNVLWGDEQFWPMWEQVQEFQRQLVSMMQENRGGLNMIGYGQGGVIARAVLGITPNHTVENFVSLASPQAGYYGDLIRPIGSRFPIGNEDKFSSSISGLWKDPRDIVRYKKEGRFLACVNNDYAHPLNQQFRNSMCRLQRLVLIGGPDDGTIVPWQSSLFDYTDSNGNLIDMTNQDFYRNDCFCLRSLDQRGAVYRHTVPGVRHTDWHRNASVIQNFIIPYLT